VEFFLVGWVGIRGGGFSLRFNFCPRARCALRLGEGPRAVGFSISMPGILTLFLPLAPNRKTKSAVPEQEQENERKPPTLA
jgi:hypothetical protein